MTRSDVEFVIGALAQWRALNPGVEPPPELEIIRAAPGCPSALLVGDPRGTRFYDPATGRAEPRPTFVIRGGTRGGSVEDWARQALANLSKGWTFA